MICNINQKIDEISYIVKNENYERKFSYGQTEDTLYYKTEITIFKSRSRGKIVEDLVGNKVE